jgi:hypothetical protein
MFRDGRRGRVWEGLSTEIESRWTKRQKSAFPGVFAFLLSGEEVFHLGAFELWTNCVATFEVWEGLRVKVELYRVLVASVERHRRAISPSSIYMSYLSIVPPLHSNI